MKCPSCGAEVAENVVICHSCGGRLEPEITPLSEEVGPQAAGPAVGAGPSAEAVAQPGAPAKGAAPARGGAKAGTARRRAAEAIDEGEFPPPWRYSIKDMRIIWLNMTILTVLFVALGVWLLTIEDQWTRPEWLTPPVFWGILLAIPILLWLYQLCKLIYRTTIRYDLDEFRLVHKEGIFVYKTNVIELIRIDDMGATQNLVEKFICGGIGKVRVHSEDPSDPVLILRGLVNHDSVFRQIDKRRAQARKKKAFVHA